MLAGMVHTHGLENVRDGVRAGLAGRRRGCGNATLIESDEERLVALSNEVKVGMLDKALV